MTNFAKTAASALTAALPFLLSSGSLSAQDVDPLSFTSEVNTAGQAAYERSCSACHLATFQGSFEAPALAGPNFSLVWTERTLNEFRATIRTMPPMAPNSLRDAEYDAITVYLLGANGAERDGRVVQADREATVGSLLAGTATAGAATASAGRGAGAGRGGGAGGRDGRGGAPRTEPEGVTETFHEIIDFEPVTEQELINPDPGDWLIYRRTYDSQGYSPLDQIDRSNVDGLGLEWVWAMADGTNQPTPLVHDGIMYLASPMNTIHALDATDGTLLWEYRREFADDFRVGFSQLRNLAIYGENIYVATKDAYLVALNARTGETVWETQIADYHLGYTNVAGVMVVEGKVINGINGCDRFHEESCFITAHDAATGEELWRLYTIARPGEPGGDTWGDLPFELRGGVDVWNTGSYDPELGLVYWGTAQAKPWVAASRGLTVEDAALYSNSTLAIDPDDGSIVWYRQHVPGESLDLDEVFERILIDRNGQRLVFSMGKHGILWKLDRETGEFISHLESIYQNVFDFIDPQTGDVRYREDIASAEVGDWVSVCPSTAGGHNWQSMSYSPEVNALIIPLSQTCLEIQGRPVALEPGSGGVGAARRYSEMPETGGRLGKLAAYEIDTMEELWSVEQRAAYLTATLTTAGGVVFVGDLDRYFRAHDVRSGEVLWQTRLGTSVQGFPVSYEVDGEQYIAVSSGLGGGSPRVIPRALSPEIQHPSTGNALYVFKLPSR